MSGDLTFTVRDFDRELPFSKGEEDKAWNENMEFTIKVKESSMQPHTFSIVIAAKGCRNYTAETKPVRMPTEAVEIPKITIERMKFKDKVLLVCLVIFFHISMQFYHNFRYKKSQTQREDKHLC